MHAMTKEMAKTKAAFLGLGEMGARMAQRLVDVDYDLAVWNRSPDKAKPFVGRARIADSPADAARGAEFIFMCLLDGAVVEDVVFGPRGAVESTASNACIIDFSTIAPAQARSADQRLRKADRGAWLDAPVSGGIAGAEAGTLAIMCGGTVADLERATPLLNVMARRITHFGHVGAGLVAKLCNQTIVASQIAAVAEAMHLAARSGLDAQKLATALQGGWADSTLFQLFAPRFAGLDLPALGQIFTMLKDADLALKAASDRRIHLPVLSAAANMYRTVGKAGHMERDLSALMQAFLPH